MSFSWSDPSLGCIDDSECGKNQVCDVLQGFCICASGFIQGPWDPLKCVGKWQKSSNGNTLIGFLT